MKINYNIRCSRCLCYYPRSEMKSYGNSHFCKDFEMCEHIRKENKPNVKVVTSTNNK